MGLLHYVTNLAKRSIARIATRALVYAGIPLRDPALVNLFGFRTNQSGVHVDEHSALTFSAYYSGVNLIASTMAMMPLHVYVETEDKGIVKAKNHNLNIFFRDGPNCNMSWFQACEMMMTHCITWGNAYFHIDRMGGKDGGMINALWPLHPSQIEPDYDKQDGRVIYKFTAMYPGEKSCVYEAWELVHITGFGFDGLCGMSVVRLAQESIGLGLATERFGGSFFGNNAIPGGVITHPEELDDIAKDNITNEIENKIRGPLKTRRVVVLDEGMKYTPIGIPPEDSQFLQTRQFQVREIARWLRIPPHMLYDMEGSTFSNIELQGLDFLIYTLYPWMVKVNGEFRHKLLREDEKESHLFRFDTSVLLAMDKKTQFEVYASGRNNSIYTLNDIQRNEGKELLDPAIGDVRIAPSTMQPLLRDQPIDPGVIAGTLKCIASLPNCSDEEALNIIGITMPTLPKEKVTALVKSMKNENNGQEAFEIKVENLNTSKATGDLKGSTSSAV